MTTTPETLRPWLGPAWDDLTAEQLARLCVEADRIDERHPDADDADLRELALSAAVQHLLGEADIDAAGAALAEAMRQVRALRATSRQLAVMTADDTDNVQASARRASIDRMTLLKDLGKR